MSAKDVVGAHFQFPEFDYWVPPHRRGVGVFRIPKRPAGQQLAKLNVFKYRGDDAVVERPELDPNEDDEDEEGVRGEESGPAGETEETPISAADTKHLHLERLPGREGRWLTILECPTEMFGILIGKGSAVKAEFENAFDVQLTFKDANCKEAASPRAGGRGGRPQQSRFEIKIGRLENGTIELRHESSRRRLLEARRAMQDQIAMKMTRLPYTHFLSLPFLRKDNESFCRRFESFRKGVLECTDPIRDQVDDTIFIEPGQMHFTLCMLRLYFKEQFEAVKEAMDEWEKNARLSDLFQGWGGMEASSIVGGSETGSKRQRSRGGSSSRRGSKQSDKVSDFSESLEALPPGFHVHLKGVSVMGDDPNRVDVLYTEEWSGEATTLSAQEKQRMGNKAHWLNIRRSASSYIHTLCEIIYQSLCDRGVLDWDELNRQRLLDSSGKPQLNLHVTLMNSKFRSSSSPLLRGHRAQKGAAAGPPTGLDDKALPRIQFNAVPILKKMADFDFGIGVVKGLHLSRRGGAAADTAYYLAEKVVPICADQGL